MEPKIQTNIENFFLSNKISKSNSKIINITTIKRFFYLSWDNEFYPDFQAIWIDKKPLKVNFMEEIKSNYVYHGYTFYLCGYFKDYNDPIYTFPKERVFKNIYFLKSHFQKSIRKQDENYAIQTCYHMFKSDTLDLLRRLSIIMIEDVQIHESYPTIIWLIIALSNEKREKFRIKRYMYEWLYGVVYTLCKIDNVNKITNSVKIVDSDESTVIQKLNIFNQYNKEECSLLYSIQIRISYGGLNGDIRMLENFTETFKENKEINNTKIQLILIYVKELSIEDLDYTALDYHCNSNFLEYISKKYSNIDIEELKKIIWHHSSGLNYRISKTSDYNLEKWNEIKNYVEQTQKYLIKTII